MPEDVLDLLKRYPLAPEQGRARVTQVMEPNPSNVGLGAEGIEVPTLLTADFEHRIVSAGPEPAPPYVAEAMDIEPGTSVVVRRRNLHDKITGQLEEIGASYIPTPFAAGTFLEEPTVVPKALFLCVEDLSGKQYARARDAWVSRLPTAQEAELFDLAPGAPVLDVIHTARADDDEVLEVSESVWPADRIMFIDEYDVPAHGEAPDVRSDI